MGEGGVVGRENSAPQATLVGVGWELGLGWRQDFLEGVRMEWRGIEGGFLLGLWGGAGGRARVRVDVEVEVEVVVEVDTGSSCDVRAGGDEAGWV